MDDERRQVQNGGTAVVAEFLASIKQMLILNSAPGPTLHLTLATEIYTDTHPHWHSKTTSVAFFFNNALLLHLILIHNKYFKHFSKIKAPVAEWSALQTAMRGDLSSIPAKVKIIFSRNQESRTINYLSY